MKCTLTVCFATALLTTGLTKATAEPALKLHFAGIENLIQREDAKTFKAVWTQKETRTLRTEALGKLAKHLAAQSGKGVSIFNSILPDIGLGETYLTIAPGERNPDVTFMAAMSKTRGGEWVKRLKQLSARDGIEPEEKTQAGYTGWRVGLQKRPQCRLWLRGRLAAARDRQVNFCGFKAGLPANRRHGPPLPGKYGAGPDA